MPCEFYEMCTVYIFSINEIWEKKENLATFILMIFTLM